jgi:hypothetical protein
MIASDPSRVGWQWATLSFTHIGQGIQFPLDGAGALTPGGGGGTAAERLAASQFAGAPRRVLLGGWWVSAPIATAALNLVFRDIEDTTTLFFDALEVLTAPASGNFDTTPFKFFNDGGLLLPRAFGLTASGTASAGTATVLYKILA